jgi:hypothetical protein
MVEEWRDIKNSDYQISNFGKIRSVDHVTIRKNGNPLPIKGRIIKQCLDTAGYYRYRFSINGKQQTKKIHRLVAEYFCKGKTKKRNHVNHIDGNPKNNRFTNLEWCTNKENIHHAIRTGLVDYSKNKKNTHLTYNQALYVREKYFEVGGMRPIIKQLAEKFNVKRGVIANIVRNKTHVEIR